jgi:hypothetical protein
MVRPCGARGFRRSGKCGLASMYPVSDWSSSWLPTHHGYQRAHDVISGQASTGLLGSPVFACAGKTDPPSSSHPLADLGGKLSYVIDSSSFCAVPLFVPGGCSFVPACACRRAARRVRQGWPSRWPCPSLPCCQAALDGAEHGASITLDGMPSHLSCRTQRRAPC